MEIILKKNGKNEFTEEKKGTRLKRKRRKKERKKKKKTNGRGKSTEDGRRCFSVFQCEFLGFFSVQTSALLKLLKNNYVMISYDE